MKNKLEIVENECPYCKEILYVNKRTFANHVRWCKQNPRYEEIRSRTIEKLKNKATRFSTKKNREIECCICGKKFSVNVTDGNYKNGNYRKTCSTECARKLTSSKINKEEKNKKISESIINHIKANGKLGVISSKNLRPSHLFKVCEYCGKTFDSKLHVEQKCCSRKCAVNYRRLKLIENIDEQDIYRSQSKFKFSLNSYPNEFDFNLIKESGWYKPINRGNNLNGISRDHMFSVDEGYKQCVDPYYISHPANCKLMKQEDNFKKLTNCTITLKELIDRVNRWNEKYGIYENKINYDRIERFRNC